MRIDHAGHALLIAGLKALLEEHHGDIPVDLTVAEAGEFLRKTVNHSGLYTAKAECRAYVPKVSDCVLMPDTERTLARVYGFTPCAEQVKLVVAAPGTKKGFKLYTAYKLGLTKAEPTVAESEAIAVAEVKRQEQHQKLYGTGRCPCCG